MPEELADAANPSHSDQTNFIQMGYTENDLAKDLENSEYKFGFTTNIESDKAPAGLNENIIRFISAKKMSQNGYWTIA